MAQQVRGAGETGSEKRSEQAKQSGVCSDAAATCTQASVYV